MDAGYQLFVLFKVVITLVLAGAIGYEREIANKPAGFRTHMIIGGVSCLLVSLGMMIIEMFSMDRYKGYIRMDIIRVIEAVIVGISFIGAGTILKSRGEEKIYYLTTAATILFSATIGVAIALEQYILGIGITFIVLLINTIIRRLDKSL